VVLFHGDPDSLLDPGVTHDRAAINDRVHREQVANKRFANNVAIFWREQRHG
jgi:hypothetical protein